MDTLEKGCQWTFQPWILNSVLYGPNDAVVQSFAKDFSDSLVRESIQNSLDAVVDMSRPVVVKFSFGELMAEDYPRLFTLKKHIEGCLKEYPNNARALELFKPMLGYFDERVLKTITVSDSNTTGMLYREGDPKCPFSAFSRSVGYSVKELIGAGGSFGFGKAAYYQMSPIRSIMISSMTQDGQTAFEGVTRLCTHPVEGIMYTDTGYYDNNDGCPCRGEWIPDQFKRSAPGTSITLLGIYKDAGTIPNISEELTKSVLKNFWLAIYEKKLVVQIGDNITIDHSQIERLLGLYYPADSKDKSSPRHYFEAYSHAEDDKHIHFSNENCGLLGQVELFVSIDPTVKTDRIAYMRKPMMLVEEKSNKTHYGLYALFLCRDDNGNVALSSLEDASHSSWTLQGKREDACKQAKQVLADLGNFVKACLEERFAVRGDTASIDIGLGYTEKDIENLLVDKTERNNPFGKNLTFDTSRTGEDSDSSNDQAKGNLGKKTRGERNANKAGNKTIGLGHSKKKSKRKGGNSTGGRTRTNASPREGENGQPFTLYSPVEYRAPAYLKNGEWYHDLIMHIDEEQNHVCIEIKIGTDDGDDSVGLLTCGPEGRLSKDKGVIEFDHLNKGVLKMMIQFKDKMRHTISLK